MTKSLSQLLEEIETTSGDRPEFDKLRSVAIELAKALEFYDSCHICSRCNPKMKDSALSSAKDIIGGDSEKI